MVRFEAEQNLYFEVRSLGRADEAPAMAGQELLWPLARFLMGWQEAEFCELPPLAPPRLDDPLDAPLGYARRNAWADSYGRVRKFADGSGPGVWVPYKNPEDALGLVSRLIEFFPARFSLERGGGVLRLPVWEAEAWQSAGPDVCLPRPEKCPEVFASRLTAGVYIFLKYAYAVQDRIADAAKARQDLALDLVPKHLKQWHDFFREGTRPAGGKVFPWE